jgi:hypothetical protein
VGLLSSIFSTDRLSLRELPSGSFTIDREGHILTSTLPQSFPLEILREIGAPVLAAFQSARHAQLPLAEIIIQYPALNIMARDLAGGALVFLMPQSHPRASEKRP